MHRYNLSNSMHIRIMGPSFLSNRGHNASITAATHEALQKRGLLDEDFHRTPEAMAYIQEKCNARDNRLEESFPGIPLVSSDLGLLGYWKDFNNVSIYVYGGTYPLVVRNGNGQRPLAILSTRYMWDVEVGMTMGVKNAGHFLQYSSIHGRKASYGYDILEDKAEEFWNFVEEPEVA